MTELNQKEKLAMATFYLDEMVKSLRADLASDPTPLTADEVAAMAKELRASGEPDWMEALLWSFAVAQIRLAGGSTESESNADLTAVITAFAKAAAEMKEEGDQ